jgi:hypothetical protein
MKHWLLSKFSPKAHRRRCVWVGNNTFYANGQYGINIGSNTTGSQVTIKNCTVR